MATPKTRAVAHLLGLGKTQAELAEAIGKPSCQGNVSRLLRHERATREYIEAFRQLGVDPAWWFEPPLPYQLEQLGTGDEAA